MTKHIGTIVLWIIAAGLALYIVQHFGDLMSGISYLKQGVDRQGFFNGIDRFFKK